MRARTLALAVVLALGAGPALAQGTATPDSSLGGFLHSLSDSTDRFFGISAAPADTAGLDTVLAESGGNGRRQVSLAPSFDFNRVDGSTPGLALSLGERPPEPERWGWGKLTGTIARAVGAHTTLGGGRYENRLRLARQRFDLTLWAGRASGTLNRDESERFLPMLRALCFGNDWAQYDRVDGFTAALAHERRAWRARVAWVDELQSPLGTTATWDLAHRDLEPIANLPAARGHAHELGYFAGLRWPGVPLRTDLSYQTSSRRLGSDFEYRRYRAAAGLDLSLGRAASLVPQLAYGRLTGEAVPQAAFYTGGDATLRTLRRDERGGAGFAIAKLELIGARDILETLHLPRSAALPLQGAIFGATSAVWGPNPYGGGTPGVDWPERRAWASEAGVSLLYASPLFFGEGSFLRVSYAWPLGPDSRISRWSVGISRALDLLGPEPREED